MAIGMLPPQSGPITPPSAARQVQASFGAPSGQQAVATPRASPGGFPSSAARAALWGALALPSVAAAMAAPSVPAGPGVLSVGANVARGFGAQSVGAAQAAPAALPTANAMVTPLPTPSTPPIDLSAAAQPLPGLPDPSTGAPAAVSTAAPALPAPTLAVNPGTVSATAASGGSTFALHAPTWLVAGSIASVVALGAYVLTRKHGRR